MLILPATHLYATKLSQDCHNLKLYCLRCRSEALKAQIIIFENHKNEIGIYFNVDTFYTPATR